MTADQGVENPTGLFHLLVRLRVSSSARMRSVPRSGNGKRRRTATLTRHNVLNSTRFATSR
jgi:hypothetical protein